MRRARLLYPLWMAICAVLFIALRGQEDPSRRPGRILSNDAAARAVAILRSGGPQAKGWSGLQAKGWSGGLQPADGGLKAAAPHAALSSPYRGYQAVHVAYAGSGEAGPTARWIVLCDRVPHTALAAAVVVELDAKDGRLIRIRKPVN
jgi:hypothetical protein